MHACISLLAYLPNVWLLCWCLFITCQKFDKYVGQFRLFVCLSVICATPRKPLNGSSSNLVSLCTLVQARSDIIVVTLTSRSRSRGHDVVFSFYNSTKCISRFGGNCSRNLYQTYTTYASQTFPQTCIVI